MRRGSVRRIPIVRRHDIIVPYTRSVRPLALARNEEVGDFDLPIPSNVQEPVYVIQGLVLSRVKLFPGTFAALLPIKPTGISNARSQSHTVVKSLCVLVVGE